MSPLRRRRLFGSVLPRRIQPVVRRRRFFFVKTGGVSALVVVTRDRGEARVQAEQARLRGARKRGGERVVAGHAHGHVAVFYR
jgi:hypothetical protein